MTAAAASACAHCGDPVKVEGAGPVFCCAGCATVWRTLNDAGLQDYYDLRRTLPRAPGPTESLGPDVEALISDDDGVRSVELRLAGMHCGSCAWVVEELGRGVPGIAEVKVRAALTSARATLGGGDAGVALEALQRRLADGGYGLSVVASDAAAVRDADRRERRGELLRLGVVAACAGNIMLFSGSLYAGERYGMEPMLRDLFRGLCLALAVPVVLYGARPILQRALGSLPSGVLHVDVPVAFAVLWMFGAGVHAVATGAGAIWFDSLGMLVTLLLAGRALEASVRARVVERLAALLARRAPTARLETGEVVAADEVRVGARVELLPGDVSALDVQIVEGRSDVDRSVVDGESRPRRSGVGDLLPAGTRVLDGRIVGTVVRAVAASTTAGLRRRVEEALSRATPMQSAADRVARWFVAAVLVAGAATWAGRTLLGLDAPMEATIAVLVVACPCALALAVPLAFAAAVHRAAGEGLLVRSGDVLLRLGEARRVVFDKTGTLTTSRPRLGEVELAGEGIALGEAAVMRAAASAARPSLHPVARAVVARGGAGLPLAVDFAEYAGHGVEATVDGRRVSVTRPGATVSIDGAVVARADLVDTLRPDAAAIVHALRRAGVEPSLLSGDVEERVAAAAREVGVQDYAAAATPRQKADRVAELGVGTVFVGDGLNDAAALAEADVGLAVGHSVDLTLEAADGVVLDDERLAPVLAGHRVGRALRTVLTRNIVISVSYNGLAVVAAAAGFIGPLEAAALMPLSSLVVVAHSARLARSSG